jgi:lysozyme
VRLLTVVLVLSFIGCGPELTQGDDVSQLEQGLTVCAGPTTIPGIDVSHFDGTITWSTVAGSGVKWAYAKATENTTFTDPEFAANWSGMKSAGVLRGAYHFFHPNVDGKLQADFFLSVVGTLQPGDLNPMLDWEVTSGASGATATANANAFIAEVRARTGRKTIIYTAPGVWAGFGVSMSYAADDLWVANYLYCTTASCCPTMPTGWTGWKMWQWSDKGTVPGVPATAVDLDLFDGTMAQLLALTGETPDAGTGTGGGTATGGGAATGGGSATGGGTATGGGSSTGGGSATGGGAGSTGGGTSDVDGGVTMDGGMAGKAVKGSCGCGAVDGSSVLAFGVLLLLRRRAV